MFLSLPVIIYRVYYFIPAVLWMAVIFSLSAMHGSGGGWELTFGQFLIRKGAHVAEFFVFTVLLVLAFYYGEYRLKKWQVILIIFFVTVLWAISDEVHQSFVPFRTPHIRDVGFDVVGISIALAGVALSQWIDGPAQSSKKR